MLCTCRYRDSPPILGWNVRARVFTLHSSVLHGKRHFTPVPPCGSSLLSVITSRATWTTTLHVHTVNSCFTQNMIFGFLVEMHVVVCPELWLFLPVCLSCVFIATSFVWVNVSVCQVAAHLAVTPLLLGAFLLFSGHGATLTNKELAFNWTINTLSWLNFSNNRIKHAISASFRIFIVRNKRIILLHLMSYNCE